MFTDWGFGCCCQYALSVGSRRSSSKGALYNREWKMRRKMKITDEKKTRENGRTGKRIIGRTGIRKLFNWPILLWSIIFQELYNIQAVKIFFILIPHIYQLPPISSYISQVIPRRIYICIMWEKYIVRKKFLFTIYQQCTLGKSHS